jgi:outer membrane protein assembly factor BamB
MHLRKLMKKRVAFIVIVTLIFVFPLLAIAQAVFHISLPLVPDLPLPTAVPTKAPIPPGSDWTMYLHNLQRTAATDERVLSTANAGQLSKLWTFKTGGPIAASAAVVEGTVYIGSWDGYEYALDQMTGQVKWKKFLGITKARPVCNPPEAGITSSATIQDGVLYVGGGDTYWYALDAKTGAILWKVFTGDNSADGGHYNWSSPLLYNGYAYIGIASEGDCPLVQGQLLQVDLNTHEVTHTFNLVPDGEAGGGIWTSPSIDPATNSIFLSTGTRQQNSQNLAQAMVVLDASTLELKSSWALPEILPPEETVDDADFDTTPILFSDAKGTPLVATVNKNGHIYVFDRNNVGAGVVWKKPIAIGGPCPICEVSSVSSNAFAQGTLYVAAGDSKIDGKNYRGSVVAMDPTDGKFLWGHGSIDGPIIGALAYANGLIVDGGGTDVEVLDATTGARLYSYNTNFQIYSAPVVSHGQIFVGSTDGTMYAFGLKAPSTGNTCLQGWSCQDIGNPVITGKEESAGDTISVTAGGTGISGKTDQLRLVSKTVSGDTQISARLVSQQLTGAAGNAQVGLMMRQSSDANSPYYGAFLTSSTGVVVQYRNSFGGNTVQDVQLPKASFPLYLRIQRVGDEFHTEVSTDGGDYTLVPGSTVKMVMPVSLNSGLAVSSHSTATMDTAVYSNVSFDPSGTNPHPPTPTTACPPEWGCNDIGNPAIPGTNTLNNDVWTVQGSGSDIWDTNDQFHYVWQKMTNHSEIIARVVSLQPRIFHSKVGIMVRQDLQPDSSYYAVFVVTQQDGTLVVSVESRSTQGIVSRQVISDDKPITTPIYLKIVHVNNEISAYTSQDGVQWTLISVSTNELVPDSTVKTDPITEAPGLKLTLDANSALAGIAISSHDTNAPVSATLDEVTIH